MRKEKPQPYTKDEIKTAFTYQKENGWTFHNEMEVTATSFNNRVNFLLVAYSLFLNVYFMVKDNNEKLTILVIGLLINFLLAISIFRSHARLSILLYIMKNLDDNDVVPFISKEYKKKRIFRFFSHATTTGLIIPIVMILSFIVGIIYVWHPF